MSTGLICLHPFTSIFEVKNPGVRASICPYYFPEHYAINYGESCVFCRQSRNEKEWPIKTCDD